MDADPDVETEDGEIKVPELPEIGGRTEAVNYKRMTPEQVGQEVSESIQSNAGTRPEAVRKALVDGMSTLVKIETRLRAESRNVNHKGLDISRAHDAYVNYFFEGGDLNASAQEVAAGIRDAIATGKLKAADVETLTDAVAKMVGDAELAEAYVAAAMDAKEESGYNKYSKAGIVKNAGKNSILALSTRFLNRMDPLWENSGKIEPIERYQDIVCHGDTISLIYRDLDGNEITLPAREFAEMLKNSPVYEGKPIRLIACEAGAEGSIVAQTVADYLGVEVMAPTDIVHVYPDGKVVIGPDQWTNSGGWKIYKPKKQLFGGEPKMIIIGQTREVYKDNKYPSIFDLINRPIKEKERVLNYMKDCEISSASPAIVTDLIEPKNKFNELFCMTDGVYGWRSDVIYYVEKYDMALPDEFVQHVLSQISKE